MSGVRFCLSLLSVMIMGGMVRAQSMPLTTVTNMPNSLEESSGLIRGHQPGQWWSHNDSGGEPKLTCFDESGAEIRSVSLIGVANVDWEEVTQDDSGFVYVGDFGNNANTRQDLVIYKIPHPDLVVGDSILPEAIHFQYPDQTAFPPAATEMKFDMEAMVSMHDSLFLFSKNRTSPFDGYTRRYSLPTMAGTYTATLIDSFFTGGSSSTSYWICGAALSPNKEHLVLLSYPRAWIFSCFEGTDFFGGASKELTYPLTQKEAAAWMDDDTLYLTDELLNGILGGKMYKSNLSLYTTEPTVFLGNDTTVTSGSLILGPAAAPGTTYVWNTGATTSQITVTTPGYYAVTVAAPNGCITDDSIYVDLQTGIVKPTHHQMHVVPLPDSGMLRILLEVEGAQEATFEIVEVNGKTHHPKSLAKDLKYVNGNLTHEMEWKYGRGYFWMKAVIGDEVIVRGFRY